MSESDFGDKSGVSSARGYDYQKLIATYYLIVKEAREIEYEADGEDFTIINENPNRDSVEYIQAKCLSTGAFTLSDFSRDVFPQFWSAYTKAVSEHPSKGIYCTLITNVAPDIKLKKFMDGCNHIHDKGLTLTEFESSIKIASRMYLSMKRSKPNDQFLKFLWGLNFLSTVTIDYTKEKIVNYISSCGISQPRQKLALVMDRISEIGQGRITRRQIEEIIGNLTQIKQESDKSIYSEDRINKIKLNLETVKSEYGTEAETPDQESIFRDMTTPIEKASTFVMHQLKVKGSISDSFSEFQESYEIVLSDNQKAKEEAQIIAGLKSELWIHEKRYTQRISSIQKTARVFGIGL